LEALGAGAASPCKPHSSPGAYGRVNLGLRSCTLIGPVLCGLRLCAPTISKNKEKWQYAGTEDILNRVLIHVENVRTDPTVLQRDVHDTNAELRQMRWCARKLGVGKGQGQGE